MSSDEPLPTFENKNRKPVRIESKLPEDYGKHTPTKLEDYMPDKVKSKIRTAEQKRHLKAKKRLDNSHVTMDSVRVSFTTETIPYVELPEHLKNVTIEKILVENNENE